MGQLKALVTKNWIIYKRNLLGSILQVLLPIAFLLFTILTRNLAKMDFYPQQSNLSNSSLVFTYYGDPIYAKTMLNVSAPTYLKKCSANKIVGLVPKGNLMVSKLNIILTALGYNVTQYNNDEEIDQIVRDQSYSKTLPQFCFGVTFDSSSNGYRYNLRFNVSTSQLPSPELKLTVDEKTNLRYFYKPFSSGALGLTTIINNMILESQLPSSSLMLVNKVGIIYQQEYIYDRLFMYLGNSFQFINLLPLLILYLRQTSFMLQQKEKKIRQSMLITGMSLPIYYFSWFIRYFIIYLIVHLINSYVVSYCLPQINYYIPIIIYILFDIILILQSFFIQIFVTRAKIGIIFALIFFVLQYSVNYAISSNANVTQQINTYMSFVPHVAYVLAFKNMLYGDSTRMTVTFTNQLSSYKLITAVYCLLGNIAFWLVALWYLDQVFPNEWGAKKGPCFCLQYKKEEQQNQHDTDGKVIPEIDSSILPEVSREKFLHHNNPNYQQVQLIFKNMQKDKKALIFTNINKIYDDFHAVKDLNVAMYTDQIFALLGHNGAGKTSIISMLTGMIEPTSGQIEVLGQRQLTRIRQKLGVCPQHDTLYDDLTVEQHLRLYAKLRGIDGEKLEQQVNSLIRDVNLEQKRHQYSKNLSGGQKRRLSVAIAFSGGSKVIVLDQPTSGMDTSARRFIWQMLKKYKTGRIIILTTHFMDEADYLGDRIAIMSQGKLMALGSNIFLKNKFGVGYNITITKLNSSINSLPIIQHIRKQIAHANILTNVSSQLTVQLPLDQVKYFSKLFSQMEGRKKELGIQSYGVSITTLQEVFLKVGDQDQKKQTSQREKQENNRRMQNDQGLEQIVLNPRGKKMQKREVEGKSQTNLQQQDQQLVREDGPCERFCTHLGATLLKRLRVIRRDIKSFAFQLVIPIIIITIAMFLMRISFVKDIGPKEFHYNRYLAEENPTPIYIGSASANSTLLDDIQNTITLKYSNSFSVIKSINPSDIEFDQYFVYPIKQANQKTRGAIYFKPSQMRPNKTLLHFTSIMNTKTPTSSISIQSLAAQSYINLLATKSLSITPINKPFPMTFKQMQTNNAISGFFGALIFSIALAFKFTSVVSFIVKQRQDRCKHQQIVSGLNLLSYWLGTYIYDILLYSIVAGFSIGMCKALDIETLTKDDAYLATSLLFVLYGVTNILLTYLLAYLFKDYGNAQGVVYFFNFVGGGIAPIIILVLRWIDQNSNVTGRGLAWLLRIIPSFSFGEGLINLSSMTLLASFENDGKVFVPFDLQISLAPILYLIFLGLLFTFLIFCIQRVQNNEKFMRAINSQDEFAQTQPIEDTDVLSQKQKCLKSNPDDFEILAKDLRKVYKIDSDKKYKVAVDNLSFGIQKGEVFGLLGVNGAGKSTTFKMLAGQTVSTAGQCYFMGMNISENLPQVRKNLGYCPQFDALIENLTVREQLQLYYDMKSLPKSIKKRIIGKMIKQLGLSEHQEKLSGTLSGGNKRKLSVGMALIGKPNIIFLDQPSTGMDPKARRFMWKIISRISVEKKQSTVILTTHSMEEAEALSSRIGIMVNGNFRCIGTPQHIKSKYGKGFQIEIKINPIRIEDVKKLIGVSKWKSQYVEKDQVNQFMKLLNSEKYINEIQAEGKGSHLWMQLSSDGKIATETIVEFILIQDKMDKVKNTLGKKYGALKQIESLGTFIRLGTEDKVSIGKLFQQMELNKMEMGISQYSVKQSTVEQIFNRLAENEGYGQQNS